jgi:hypothetical protein
MCDSTFSWSQRLDDVKGGVDSMKTREWGFDVDKSRGRVDSMKTREWGFDGERSDTHTMPKAR